MCFFRSCQNYLSRYHAIISYLSRLPSRKIKIFPVSWAYLIPFPSILKYNFPISHLKKWQIPRPEKALLGPSHLPLCESKQTNNFSTILELRATSCVLPMSYWCYTSFDTSWDEFRAIHSQLQVGFLELEKYESICILFLPVERMNSKLFLGNELRVELNE